LSNGSESARSYRGAQLRGWLPEAIFDYWAEEIWGGPYSVDDEQGPKTLSLLAELLQRAVARLLDLGGAVAGEDTHDAA